MKRTFDRKFGDTFLDAVPRAPGVYRYVGADGVLVYVGKAADLRARLGQYRNARRGKAHRKMRQIVRESAALAYEITASERDALLLENALIQEHRPPLNVEGAFSFLYPAIGWRRTEHHLDVAHGSHPDLLSERGFEVFGVYRNRSVTRAGFDALVDLLERVGHRERAPERLPHTAWRRFRQVPATLDQPAAALLGGTSTVFLEEVAILLIERASARRDAPEVQTSLRRLRRFFQRECTRLARLRALSGVAFIPQEERDSADIRAGFPPDGDDGVDEGEDGDR